MIKILLPRFVSFRLPLCAFLTLAGLNQTSWAAQWDPLWVNTLSDSPVISDVTGDSLGNAYLTGRIGSTIPGAEVDGLGSFLIKYDGDGSQVWARQFGPASAASSTVDPFGGVITVGQTTSLVQPPSGFNDSFVRKYSDDGSLLWTRQFGTTLSDRALGVDTDMLGNIYVTGTQNIFLGPGVQNSDIYLRKYDPQGSLVWERTVDSGANDSSNAVTVDSLGNVFIGGWTDGLLANPDLGLTDAVVIKFDTAGNKYWTRQISGNAIDELYDLDSDGLGNVYVTGYRANDQGFIRKYNTLGQVEWQQLPPDVFGYGSISVDGVGNIYAGGVSSQGAFISKYALDGTPLSTYYPTELAYTSPLVYGDSFRGVFGANTDFNARTAIIAKYDVVPEPASLFMLIGLICAVVGSRRSMLIAF